MPHIPGHNPFGFGAPQFGDGLQIGAGVPGVTPQFAPTGGGFGPFQGQQQAQQQLQALRAGTSVPPIGVGIPGAAPQLAPIPAPVAPPISVGVPGQQPTLQPAPQIGVGIPGVSPTFRNPAIPSVGTGGFQDMQQAQQQLQALRAGGAGIPLSAGLGQVPGQAPQTFQAPVRSQALPISASPGLNFAQPQIQPGQPQFLGGTSAVGNRQAFDQLQAQQQAQTPFVSQLQPVQAPTPQIGVQGIPPQGLLTPQQAPAVAPRPQAAFREDGATLRAPALAARQRAGGRIAEARGRTAQRTRRGR